MNASPIDRLAFKLRLTTYILTQISDYRYNDYNQNPIENQFLRWRD